MAVSMFMAMIALPIEKGIEKGEPIAVTIQVLREYLGARLQP